MLRVLGRVTERGFEVCAGESRVNLDTLELGRDGGGSFAVLVSDQAHSLGRLRIRVTDDDDGLCLLLETHSAAVQLAPRQLLSRLGGDEALLRLIAPPRRRASLVFEPDGSLLASAAHGRPN